MLSMWLAIIAGDICARPGTSKEVYNNNEWVRTLLDDLTLLFFNPVFRTHNLLNYKYR